MIDYEYIIDSLIEEAKSLGVDVEYVKTESNVKIVLPKGFTYAQQCTPKLTNECYKHLLKMMFFQLIKDESKRVT